MQSAAELIHTPVDRYSGDCDLMSSLLILWHRRHGFLMQLRTDDAPIMPSCVGFFGGGIRQGETPHAAALREMQEELGLCADLQFHIVRIAAVEPDHKEQAYFFSAELHNDHYPVFEGAAAIWVDPENPPKGLYPRDVQTLLGFPFAG